jgi:hypothetical protein
LKNNIVKFLLFTWVYLWIWFAYRAWFLKEDKQNNLYQKYGQILKSGSLEEKVEAVVGSDIYGFIRFCKDTLPADARYQIEGIEPLMDYFRVVYFLYPLVPVGHDPEYVLAYNAPMAAREGYLTQAVLEKRHVILRKEGFDGRD